MVGHRTPGRVEAPFPGAGVHPDHCRSRPPSSRRRRTSTPTWLAAEALRGPSRRHRAGDRGRAGASAPPWPTAGSAVGLARLEAEGFAMRGRFDPALDVPDRPVRPVVRPPSAGPDPRLHPAPPPCARSSRSRAQDLDAVPPAVAARGPRGPSARAGPGSWPSSTSSRGSRSPPGPGRRPSSPPGSSSYQGAWLEDLCLSGELVWGRLALRPPTPTGRVGRRGSATPSRATPVTFALRDDLPWLLQAARGDALPPEPAHGAGARRPRRPPTVRGACSTPSCGDATGRLPVEVEEGLWDLVARGIVTADGFQAVRSLLSARQAWKRRHRQRAPGGRGAGGGPRPGARAARGGGRSCPKPDPDDEPDWPGRAGGRAAAGPVGRGLLGPHGP